MRIVHLSDLHFGRHDLALAGNLAADLESQSPGLVVVSGDFTQVGSASEFREARAFLDTLKAPVFAVPGNHDVPAVNLLLRFLDPYRHYREHIADDLEPFLEMDGVALAGVKTPRRMRAELDWSHGSISRSQLEKLGSTFRRAAPDAVRIVVAHHPLLEPETPAAKPMRPIHRSSRALQAFAGLGVRLVLSGHFHLSYVRRFETGTREGIPPGPREAAAAPILVAQASSTISTRLRGEPNAYNVIDIDDGVITIRVREWNGGTWTTREKASTDA